MILTIIRPLRRRFGATLAIAVGLSAATTLAAEPVLKRVNPRDWILRASVELNSFPRQTHIGTRAQQTIWVTQFEFQRAALVYPILKESASHKTFPERMEYEITADSEPVRASFGMMSNYQAGERMGRWRLPSITANEINFELNLPFRAWDTEYDDARAATIDWPNDPWPPIAASALQPQMFVESDHRAIKNLVAHWTDGRPERWRPAVLAKVLAARAIEHFQVEEQRYRFGRNAQLAGLNVHGAAYAARNGEGSAFDFAAFLTALYRAAGLPARVVIGYDLEASLGSRLQIRDHGEDCVRDIGDQKFPIPILRAWVEFYLLDEDENRAEWIPVDIAQQRRVSSKPRPIDQPWKFFGNNKCFDNMAPISFHFHPPTTVVNAGPPALWGWLAAPRLPRIEQRLDFGATEPPKGSGAED